MVFLLFLSAPKAKHKSLNHSENIEELGKVEKDLKKKKKRLLKIFESTKNTKMKHREEME